MTPTTPSYSDFSSDQDENLQKETDNSSSIPKTPEPASYSSDSGDSESAPTPLHRPSQVADPSIKSIATKPMDETPNSKSKKPAAISDASMSPPNPTSDTEGKKREAPEDDITSGEASEMRYPLNEYTRTRVSNKVRRLRKNYSTISGKSKKGDVWSPSQDHEYKLYDLSRKLWGSNKRSVENGNGNKEEVETTKIGAKKSKNDAGTTRVLANVGEKNGVGNGSESLYPTLNEIVTRLEIEHANGSMRGAFRRALKLLKTSERKELEKKWARQCAAEMELYLSQVELKKELIGKFGDILNNGSR